MTEEYNFQEVIDKTARQLLELINKIPLAETTVALNLSKIALNCSQALQILSDATSTNYSYVSRIPNPYWDGKEEEGKDTPA